MVGGLAKGNVTLIGGTGEKARKDTHTPRKMKSKKWNESFLDSTIAHFCSALFFE